MATPTIEDILEGRFAPAAPWIDLSLLPPLSMDGKPLTPDEVRNLAAALIAQPGFFQDSLPVIRKHFDPDTLDALSAALIPVSRKMGSGFSLYATLQLAAVTGGPQTSAALRGFLLMPGPVWTEVAINALLRIEGPADIAAAVAAARDLETHCRNEIDKQIGAICAKHNIGPQERELRSLPADPTARKAATDILNRLWQGGFAWTEKTLRETIFTNPLLQDLASTLVWGELTPTGHVSRTFLLTPDATPQFPIVLVHPSQITPEEAQIWKSTTTPAFPQFDKRPADGSAIHLPTTAVSPSALLTGLEAKGWTRARLEANTLRQHSKTFPLLHCTARLRYTGIPVYYGGTWTAQQAVSAEFDPPQNTSPIAISEINADLAAIFGNQPA